MSGAMSLYIHAPFCAGACDYCDFYSIPVKQDDERLDRFVTVLLGEAEERLRRFNVTAVPTLYIGGGTPSLLGAGRMRRLLAGLRVLLPQWPGEATVEVNPESADEEFLTACLNGGVNRISAGVQSFHEPSRLMVRRVGNGKLLPQRLALLASLYGEAFSADLIAGLPGQHEGALREDLARLLAFKPGHVSLYALTLEDGVPLADASSPIPLLPEDEADRLWLIGRDILENAGYAQYEVSNFALPGRRSAHNIRYWRMENWIGLGPAASSTIISTGSGGALAEGRRYVHAPDVDAYLAERPAPAEEYLDARTLIKETCLMGFRYREGPDRELFIRRFYQDIEEYIPRALSRWRKRGLMVPGMTALNREGLLFLNAFLVDVFAELDGGSSWTDSS
ncbi:MAG: coproporphyrinogen III oxidase family protein [Treponema sp.]|jgi:oxygen-independent coproporphyrinogen-3 oxidase|nr:coproporphyrinogen III oxidase family protein [Treponema sp.]